MPKLSEQEAEELFQLFKKANIQDGITPLEAKNLIVEFRGQLQKIWDAGSKPMPFVFKDFQHHVVEQLLERLRKEARGERG